LRPLGRPGSSDVGPVKFGWRGKGVQKGEGKNGSRNCYVREPSGRKEEEKEPLLEEGLRGKKEGGGKSCW